jgi:hypothetical protein
VVSESLMALARKRLDSMAFVGLTDRINDGGRLLAHLSGWDLDAMHPANETSPDEKAKGERDDHRCAVRGSRGGIEGVSRGSRGCLEGV